MSYARYYYDKKRKDFTLKWGAGSKGAAALFHNILYGERMVLDTSKSPLGFKFIHSVIKELQENGYDVTTLRIEVKKLTLPASETGEQ